ncbi:MAG: Nucleoside triphosphate pyrophosphohydrolase [bacterium ADurb.Bin425]|nr:MAG: Nucleoside triphosphate pyrophosphohydrolase [bacterium ADurb.Bin425]
MIKTSNLNRFVETIARLRAPDGCPWDREQTHKTLARYLLEEAYEVLEAIQSEDADKLKEELGDLLLQIVLNAQVAKDDGKFDMEEVAGLINEKMIRRHPHVFADADAETPEAVVDQWQAIKAKEKAEREAGGKAESILESIPKAMPALLQALKISEAAVNQGFEWEREGDVWDKLDSEISELKEAISNPDLKEPQKTAQAQEEIALEFGDVLFCLVNVARWHALNPEECLLLTMQKFRKRFYEMEKAASKPLKELNPTEWNDLWEEAKRKLSNKQSL